MSKIDNATRIRHMRDAAVEAIGFISDRNRVDTELEKIIPFET